jgi:hypothetical protein
MLELMSYGLTGMAAMVVLASGFAYGDEFLIRGKRSINLADEALGLVSRRSCERHSAHSGVTSKSAAREVFHG